MMWYWGSGSGVQWWGWLLMALFMVVFWGLVIWAIVFFVRSMTGNTAAGNATPDRPDEGDPERMLARRFAIGDIDEEEYHRRLGTLRHREPMGSETDT